jgi:hypothetical protein
MPIEDKVETYSVRLAQDNFLNTFRSIRLSLESGGTAFITFPKVRPVNFLEFVGSATNLSMTEDQFTDVYHLLQSESPVFFTALNFLGIQVGAVHTELDLSAGETPGEGDQDPQSLEELIRRVREADASSASG